MVAKRMGLRGVVFVAVAFITGGLASLWMSGTLYAPPSNGELAVAEGRLERCGTWRGPRGAVGFSLRLAGVPTEFTSASSPMLFQQACERMRNSPQSVLRVSYTPSWSLQAAFDPDRAGAVLWAVEQDGRLLVPLEETSAQHRERRRFLGLSVVGIMFGGIAFAGLVAAFHRRRTA